MYKERAEPPIGGPTLHNSCAKRTELREGEGVGRYQEVEVLHVFKTWISKNLKSMIKNRRL